MLCRHRRASVMIRVVIAKPGLDGHDRGALQEDADAVGISILSGAHMTLVPRILDGLKAQGLEDVLVVVGGTIPEDDAAELRELGVAAVFTPGAHTSEIVEFLREKCAPVA